MMEHLTESDTDTDDFTRLELAAEIEEFVKEVLATENFNPTKRNNSSDTDSQAVSYMRRLTRYITPEMYSRFDYRSPYIQLFLASCRELSVHEHFIVWVNRSGMSRSEGAMRIVERIRSLAKGEYFRPKLFAHHNWGKLAFKRCAQYVDKLFRRYSRYTVIRIDLAYKAAHVHHISLSRAKQGLDDFLHGTYADRPPVFEKMAGYIWKIEFGIQSGFHFHLLLFFRNVHGARARYWADELGKFWSVTVTDGDGRFDNCNAREYTDNGLGEVNRSDTKKVGYLYNRVLAYLFKAEQRIPVRRADKKFRSFGTGELPRFLCEDRPL